MVQLNLRCQVTQAGDGMPKAEAKGPWGDGDFPGEIMVKHWETWVNMMLDGGLEHSCFHILGIIIPID